MEKPQGYDDVPVMGDYTPIQLGGHRLVILGVKEVDLRGYKAITVQIDTAKDDVQPGFFQKAYKEDTRDEKKYGGNINIFTETKEFNGRKRNALKAFLTAVENSNEGFKVQWGEKFCQSLKGKSIGGVFGEEEFIDSYGEIRTARKLRYFRKLEDVMEADVPKKKEIDKRLEQTDSFINIPEDADEEIPFA